MVSRKSGTLPWARAREYQIHDRKALAAVLREAVTQRHGGIYSAAARSIGIPNSTLQRYREERGPAVRRETLEKLLALVGRARSQRLSDAVLSPSARVSLADYDTWLKQETQATRLGGILSFRLSGSNKVDSEEHKRLANDAANRGIAIDRLLASLRTRFSQEWKSLENRLKTGRHDKARARLAFLRVVAPLLATEDTGYIERAWHELSEEELRDFVKAGITREIVLLGRESDIRRAQSYESRLWTHAMETGLG